MPNGEIKTALIIAPSRGSEVIFRRPLLERLILNCERAGLTRLFVQAPTATREKVLNSLGRYRDSGAVSVVSSFDELLGGRSGFDPSQPCVKLSGNLVLSTSDLRRILGANAAPRAKVVSILSADRERDGEIVTGPLAEVLGAGPKRTGAVDAAQDLPFALDGRPKDRREAEERLARALKDETFETDTVFARHFDRNLSWPMSLRLARTAVTPNQVTIANTMLGLLAAWMFASASYWTRLLGSLLFVFSIIVDGVDGELARLTMTESKFGGMLDTITDNVVHVAVFAGILYGCYLASGSAAYLYLMPISLGGFGLCAIATYRAFQIRGPEAEQWIGWVHRQSGRDFAYLLALLALIDRLRYFAWATALGTYVFGLALLWATNKRRQPGRDSARL